MSSASEEYTLTWNDHGKKISISFGEFLDQNEFIDVTLVADGYLFNAHRLILSAFSSYFYKMFTQVPANQQAFVFLKDVSKQTLEDLIKFIYSGEVNVNQKNVNEFLDAAKIFKIKGLFDDSDDNNTSRWSSSAQNGSQHQSTQTIPVRVQVLGHSNSASVVNNLDPPLDEFENSTEMDQPVYEIPIENNKIFDGYDMSGEDESMDQQYNAQDDERNAYYDNEANEMPQIPRQAAVVVGYDTIADIQPNLRGNVNLFHNGYKFHRNGNKYALKQNWQCCRHNKNHCRASASTMEIDGVIMMKISIAEHTHDP